MSFRLCYSVSTLNHMNLILFMLPRITPNETLETTYQQYVDALRETKFTGEIRTDYATRLTMATDNSIYQVIPQAVLFPKNTQDISIILTLSQNHPFHSVTFSPRGGGTGTNGQSLSAGIIIDCSKHMHAILEVNVEQGWVRVQAGVILDQLNQFLKPHGVHFAPEISPSNRATIGGMINTDACGNGSKIIGRTSDHVIELTSILCDGSLLETKSNTHDSLKKPLTTILVKHQTLIQEKFFNAPRTLSGYNLAKAYQHNQLDLNYLLCGAEGTLAIVSECKLKLTRLPSFKKCVVIKYHHFEDALRAKEITSEIKPLVIETIDEKLIHLAKEDALYFYLKEIIHHANSINLVEFVGDDLVEMDKQITALCENIQKSPHTTGFYVTKNDAEIKLLWELRKKSVGLISKRQDGTRRPIPFIEDTAVPPEKLADYIAEFKQLLDQHQLIYGMYGHVDAGCIHVRPALDTRLSSDEKLLQDISDDVVTLVKKYGGVIWGEHGKGFRSEYGPVFFGDTLYHALRQIKTLFDPRNQLNPGKIVTPLDSPDEIVRVNSALRGHFDKEISNTANQQYASAIACNGNGACFHFSTQDVMCPSYKVTQDRLHSPKGRATVIREWVRQLTKKNYDLNAKNTTSFFTKIIRSFIHKPDFSHEVYSALSGCLACKACMNQCPLSVDVPDFKAKFLAHYHRRYARKARDYLIANTENIAHLQSKFPALSNRISENKITRALLKKYFQLVDLPKIENHKTTSFQWLPHSINQLPSHSIIVLQDAFTAFYEKSIFSAAYQLFTALGFSVYVAPFFPSGKPFHVKGFLNRFTQIAKNNIDYLRKLAGLNVPLIGLDPSITLTYRDEYQKCIGAEKLGFTVLLPQEFLHSQLKTLPKIITSKQYYLLSHCTEKTAHIETEKEWQTIFSTLGLTLTSLSAGCCGMAGSYGHETEHVEYSRALFNMDWQRYIHENPDAKKFLLATGYSCRSQVKRINGIRLQHPLEALLNDIKELS